MAARPCIARRVTRRRWWPCSNVCSEIRPLHGPWATRRRDASRNSRSIVRGRFSIAQLRRSCRAVDDPLTTMCGIFGLVGLGRDLASRDLDAVAQGTEGLKHRGPDGGEIITADRVCLGHRRLSIVDIEGGLQPMWSADGRGIISYNGEVYNFEALEKEMIGSGRKFLTRSDTEAVLNAYLEWGADAVRRLRGMFAFAAYDKERSEVLLARDRLGKKPLYYTIQNGVLAWSSELEPLYRTLGPFKLDHRALDDYLAWQYVPSPRTIYHGVHSLPPGHLATINLNTGRVDVRKYWQLEFSEDRSVSFEEWGERLDAAIRDRSEERRVGK